MKAPLPIDHSTNRIDLLHSNVESNAFLKDKNSGIDQHIDPSLLYASVTIPETKFPPTNSPEIHHYDSFPSKSQSSSKLFSDNSAIKSHALSITSQKSQQLRRKLMMDSKVLIIGAGNFYNKFIYDQLKELGVNTYVINRPDSIWRGEAEKGGIAGFIALEFTDNDNIFERAMESIAALYPEVQFDAVTTYFEGAVVLAARIATALGVATNSVDACDKARNKRKTREEMNKAGLPVPRFQKVLTEGEVGPACDYVGFPNILKPVIGTESIGVMKAHSKEEAMEAYQKIMKTMTMAEDTTWTQGTEMIMEEYFDGDEFDIDVLLWKGQVVYAKVSDNWACWEPWFQEVGTNCPSIYPKDQQDHLIKLSFDSVLALGFRYGCLHVECRYTSRGPRLTEVDARMGGQFDRDANLLA